MNIFTLGLRVTDGADTDENKVTHVLAESLPSSDKRVATKVQLSMKEDHYVGKILKTLEENQTILAIGPTKTTPDGVLQMQPMLVVTDKNWDDLLAVNLFISTGGLGPAAKRLNSATTPSPIARLPGKTKREKRLGSS